MAKYDYRCENCGHEFEATQKMTDDKLTTCPECNKETLKRLIGGTMVVSSNNELALNVAVFCHNELELERSIDIQVKPLDVDGFCYSNGLIEIDESLEAVDMIMAVCHEMVHAKQYETGGVADEDEAYTKELELQRAYITHYNWRKNK